MTALARGAASWKDAQGGKGGGGLLGRARRSIGMGFSGVYFCPRGRKGERGSEPKDYAVTWIQNSGRTLGGGAHWEKNRGKNTGGLKRSVGEGVWGSAIEKQSFLGGERGTWTGVKGHLPGRSDRHVNSQVHYRSEKGTQFTIKALKEEKAKGLRNEVSSLGGYIERSIVKRR